MVRNEPLQRVHEPRTHYTNIVLQMKCLQVYRQLKTPCIIDVFRDLRITSGVAFVSDVLC